MNKTLWFIAIIPPEQICAQVRAIQQEIADRFGPRRILKIPVHITIEAPFRYPDADAPRMAELLAGFFASKESFSLELKNFGTFRDDVVFIELVPSLPLLEIQSALSAFLRAETGIIKGEPWQGGYTPHTTVANRDVTPETHKRIWREFNTRKFYATFPVTEVGLLRHGPPDTMPETSVSHNENQWQVHRCFPLHKSP